MVHWKTDANRSQMKKRAKKGAMTKKQLKTFYGHGFGPLEQFGSIKAELAIGYKTYNVVLYPDKNGNICDISGLDDETRYTALNMLRGQAIGLWIN